MTTKTFPVISLDKYSVVVDKEASLEIGKTIIHGNTELKQGWNWGIHLIKDEESLMYYRDMRIHFEKIKSKFNVGENIMTEPIVATIGKRIENLPLIELPKEEDVAPFDGEEAYYRNTRKLVSVELEMLHQWARPNLPNIWSNFVKEENWKTLKSSGYLIREKIKITNPETNTIVPVKLNWSEYTPSNPYFNQVKPEDK